MNVGAQVEFNEWMAMVDEMVSLRTGGMTTYEMADQDYWAWWECGMTPLEAAEEALVDEGFYDFVEGD